MPTEPVNAISNACTTRPRWRIVNRPSRLDPTEAVFAIELRVFWFFWKEVTSRYTLEQAKGHLYYLKKAYDISNMKKEIVYESD
jgi:hypothetical protein